MHGSRVKGLVQRVARAAVHVGDECTGAIGSGLFALVGVGHDDDERDAALLADRMVGLRVFPDAEGKMNRSLADIGGAALIVSQFTLAADTSRGNRPGFSQAAKPDAGRALYEQFIRDMDGSGIPTATGSFGADMAVSLTNDGPVTIWMDV